MEELLKKINSGKTKYPNKWASLNKRKKDADFQRILGRVPPKIREGLQKAKFDVEEFNLEYNPTALGKLSQNLQQIIEQAKQKELNYTRLQQLKNKVNVLLKQTKNNNERHKLELSRKKMEERQQAIKNEAAKAFNRKTSRVPQSFQGPYGGDKQFGLAVSNELRRMENVVRNEWEKEVNAYFKSKSKTSANIKKVKEYYQGGPKPLMKNAMRKVWENEVNAYFFNKHKTSANIKKVKDYYNGSGPKPQVTAIVQKLTPSSGYGQKKS